MPCNTVDNTWTVTGHITLLTAAKRGSVRRSADRGMPHPGWSVGHGATGARNSLKRRAGICERSEVAVEPACTKYYPLVYLLLVKKSPAPIDNSPIIAGSGIVVEE